MEWTGQQQLVMLMQSGGVGFLLGATYDLFFAVGRVRRSARSAVFVKDILFCLLSAVFTFYFSLMITDGQLHPLLFLGIALGMVAERGSVGRLLRLLRFWLSSLFGKVRQIMVGVLARLHDRMAVALRVVVRRLNSFYFLKTKKSKKIEKV